MFRSLWKSDQACIESLEARMLLSGEISLVLAPAQLNENDIAQLTGTLAAPLTVNQTLAINWGDNSYSMLGLTAGQTSFTAQHQYVQDSGGSAFTIAAAVGTLSGTTSAQVLNVAPVITAASFDPAQINENDFTMLSGTFTDPGTLDAHSLLVDWGDGSTQTVSIDAGATTFGVLHQYLNNPAGGQYSASLTLSDDGGGSSTSTSSVTVNNVAPVVYSLTIDPVTIDENGVATLNGSFTDPGTLDTHTVAIDWGDGSTQQLTLTIGDRTFSAEHQYLDDNPTGTPSDIYNVNVAVTDSDNGIGLAATTVTVNNVAPTVTQLQLTPAVIDENGVATLTGAFTDPGTLDTHTVSIDWGDGSDPQTLSLELGARTFTAEHQYLDDNPSGTPSDQYTVNVTVTDDDTGVGTSATTITVNNVPPVITSVTSSAPGVGDAAEGQLITVQGAFTDVGTLDTHTAVIDWGDGTTGPATITETGGSGTFTGTHAYQTGGIYTVGVTVTDDDTGSASANATAVISGVGIHDGVLQIIGTDAADSVHLNTFRGGSQVKVHASFLSDRGGQRNLSLSGVTRIETLLGDGNDSYQMAGNMKLLTVVDGGAGNDNINVGSTQAIVWGGAGDDTIKGGHGKVGGSILIGGDGVDSINSHVNSRDIVIGGSTTLDPNDAAITADFDQAMLDALAQWNGGTTPTLSVVDDGLADSLKGGKGKGGDLVFEGAVAGTVTQGHGNGQGHNGGSNVGNAGDDMADIISASAVMHGKAGAVHGNGSASGTGNGGSGMAGGGSGMGDILTPVLDGTATDGPGHSGQHGHGNKK